MSDSDAYLQKRARFDRLLTIYGRKPVLEALQDPALQVVKLHLAESNRRGGIIADIEALAAKRGIEVARHERAALARISRNGRQDQGVAADIEMPHYQPCSALPARYRLLAVDGVTNPTNLGMIIRSIAASGIDGLLLARRGQARLDAQVIKASAGTLFKARLYYCDSMEAALRDAQQQSAHIVTLAADAECSLFDALPQHDKQIYVLGNETSGVSDAVREISAESRAIPMHNGVESLNVAVTAALVAFRLGQG